MVVYNLRSITKVKCLLRLTEAILNLLDQNVGILKPAFDRKAALTLTSGVRMLWSALGPGGQKMSCLCKLGR